VAEYSLSQVFNQAKRGALYEAPVAPAAAGGTLAYDSVPGHVPGLHYRELGAWAPAPQKLHTPTHCAGASRQIDTSAVAPTHQSIVYYCRIN
jgi:hypothetical protein